jgi:hypothetical protein
VGGSLEYFGDQQREYESRKEREYQEKCGEHDRQQRIKIFTLQTSNCSLFTVNQLNFLLSLDCDGYRHDDETDNLINELYGKVTNTLPIIMQPSDFYC